MKRFFTIVFIIFISVLAYGGIFKDIKTEDEAKQMYEYYKNLLSKNTNNYEYAWKLCAFARFYGFYFIKDKTQREKIFEEAKNAGELAIKLNPNGVEGNYFLGVAYGSWAEEKGIMNSLFLAGPIVDLMTKVINIDPSFRDGAGYMVRGRVYSKAPGWPLSIGDINKATDDFEKAIKYPNRTAYRYYSEFLINKGNYKKAKELIEKGLTLPPSDEQVVDEYEIKNLKDLQAKIKDK